MAALYPHKRHGWEVVYYIHFPDGTRKRKYKTAKIKTEALLALQDAEKFETYSIKQTLSPKEITFFLHKKFITREEAGKLLNKTIGALPEDITWATLEKHYISYIKRVGSPSTQQSYPHKIKSLMEHFNGTSPLSIDKTQIEQYIFLRRKKVSRATVNKEIIALRTMLDHLVDSGLMDKNPAREIKLFSDLPQRLPRCLAPLELKAIMKSMKNYFACRGYFAEIIITYLFTGMRRYELLNLKKNQIDLRRRFIRIIGKGDKERRIELHPVLLKEIFPSVIKKNEKRQGPYFFGGYEQPLMNENSLGRAFRIFLRRHNLYNENSLHTLRHTFLSYLIDAGVNIKQVQEIAGHESLKTTMKYLHVVPSKTSGINKLDYSRYFQSTTKLQQSDTY
ncbi:MAG: tyrosine-type recombinase/integrase [Pseudomonadota bacterium]